MRCPTLAMCVASVAWLGHTNGEEACGVRRGHSLLQFRTAVESESHAITGDEEDFADAHREDAGASARDLHIAHASRSAQLERAKDRAAIMLLTMKDAETNVVRAQARASEEDVETTPVPNLTDHYLGIIDNATLCRECGLAEQELIAVTETALAAHRAAQSAAAFLGEAAQTYAVAVQGFESANQAYKKVADELCPITLTYEATQASFSSISTAAQQLSLKASIAQQWKAWEDGNKSIVDAAQSQYDTAAEAAVAADKPVADKKTAEEAACAEYVTEAPTPAPTPAPTQAPTLGDDSAVHTCCLPNSIVRVLYPAGSLPAPASSIRLLIAKQNSYHVSYKGIAIGEQDGDGANMKPGTIASFNNGDTVRVTQDTWTEALSYNIEADRNYLISFYVVVGPDGWVQWEDQGKKVFVRDWESADKVVAPTWNPSRTIQNKVYNIKAIEAE